MLEPDDFLFGGAETYAEKNEDYGDSWRKIGQIMHMLAGGEPVVLRTPEDHVAYGLYTRRLDKFARAYNGEFISDDLNFESTEDAHSDEMVYAAMHASNERAKSVKREADKAVADELSDLNNGTSSVGMWHPTTKVLDPENSDNDE